MCTVKFFENFQKKKTAKVVGGLCPCYTAVNIHANLYPSDRIEPRRKDVGEANLVERSSAVFCSGVDEHRVRPIDAIGSVTGRGVAGHWQPPALLVTISGGHIFVQRYSTEYQKF